MTESIPLMSGHGSPDRKLTVKQEVTLWSPAVEDSEDEDKLLFAESKSRTTSLAISDLLIMICQLLQVYCLLDAMALRWTWPEDWLFYTRPILLLNLDVWTFMKLSVNETYKSVQGYHIPSEDIPVPFWVLLLLWAAFILIAGVIYAVIYCSLKAAHHPYMFVKIARLQRVYIVMMQVLAVPYGTCVAHVFHCNDNDFVDIDNTLRCTRDQHWAYITPVIIFSLVYYILFPIWMIIRTRNEMLSMPVDRHEAYLQLKETEYVHGMEMGWIVGHFHVFGSFKKYGAYYRPAVHWIIFSLVLFYALAHNSMDIQAFCTVSLIFLVFLAFVVVRPFRIMVFNVALILSWLFLSVDALFGALLSTHSASGVDSVWLLPDYMLRLLAGVNGVWIFVLILFTIYVFVRHYRCCCSRRKACREPLWPALTSNRIHKLSPHTRMYVKAILRGRMLIEQILKMSPLFAPAHELGRQIHIINAYCREAEILSDPMQNSLWDLLDQLIEVHGQVAPKSLFAESVKDSIRSTAQDLMRMMPAFSRRMAQREYDFLLMNPIKRRMLLKMFCMGLFLNQRRETQQRHRLTVPYLQKVWKQKRHETQVDELPDDGYYEDMYPEHEPTPGGDVFQDETFVTMELVAFDDKEIDDEVVLEEAESWAKDHPIPALTSMTSQRTYTNLVFEDDSDSESTDPSSEEEEADLGETSHVPVQTTESHDLFHTEDESKSHAQSPDRGGFGGNQDLLLEDSEMAKTGDIINEQIGNETGLVSNSKVSSSEQGQGNQEPAWNESHRQGHKMEDIGRGGASSRTSLIAVDSTEPVTADVPIEPQLAKSPDHSRPQTGFRSQSRIIAVTPVEGEGRGSSPTPGGGGNSPTQVQTEHEGGVGDFAV